MESALFDSGAVAVSLEDAGDEALFEPGATWSEAVMVALFDPLSHSEADILQALKQSLPELPGTLPFEHLVEQDWVALTQSQFQPKAFGTRLWVAPSWAQAVDAPVLLRLDPGQAFGTGAHPTTTLCLQWLDQQVQGQEIVLDYGCGSGILAIAGLLLGAQYAYAVDNDPEALLVAADNARRNGVEARLWLGLPDQFDALQPAPRIDTLVANILAGPLQTLAPLLATYSHSRTRLALSGVLKEQAQAVSASYQPFFSMQQPVLLDDWVRLDGTGRQDPP